MTLPWLDADIWTRDSRGRSWPFALPPSVIRSVVANVSAERGDQLELLTCTLVKAGAIYRSIYRASPWAALENHAEPQHFIRSRRLTPALPAPDFRSPPGWTAFFAANGLVLLQHPDPARHGGNVVASRLGIVPRVRDNATGELRVHTEYDELYGQLKARFAREISRLSRGATT